MLTIEMRLILTFLVGLGITYVTLPTVNEWHSYRAAYPEYTEVHWCQATRQGKDAKGILGPIFAFRCVTPINER